MRLVLSFLILSLLAYAGYLGICWVGSQYTLVPSAERPGLALISILALVSVLLVSGAIRYAAREQALRGLLEQRYRLYQLALGSLQQEDLLLTKQSDINNSLALLGSRAVLRAYRKLQEEIAVMGPGSPFVPEKMNKLTQAMRTDLCQSNFEMGIELKAMLPSQNKNDHPKDGNSPSEIGDD